MFLAAPGLIPYFSPNCLFVCVAASLLSCAISELDRLTLAPEPGTGPVLPALPFAIMSRTLSSCVPRNRWFGFTHCGLSHECKTFIPSGIAPLCNSHDTRWAYSMPSPLRPAPIRPYLRFPFLSFKQLAVQTQQSPEVSTFAQNLSSSVRLVGKFRVAICTFREFGAYRLTYTKYSCTSPWRLLLRSGAPHAASER